MTDRIEKVIDLKSPVERVWRALTDPAEFGAYPGFEHLPWESRTVAMEEPRYFAFSWPPYYGEIDADTSGDPWTLVEFRLEAVAGGTRLTLTESGFDALPADRRPIAFRGNEGGWEEQMRNIKAHVDG